MNQNIFKSDKPLKRLDIPKRFWGFSSVDQEKQFIVKTFNQRINAIRTELKSWKSVPSAPLRDIKKEYHEYWGLRNELEALQRAIDLLK